MERIKTLPLAHPVDIALAADLLLESGLAADAGEVLDGAVRLWPADAALAALHLAARLLAGPPPSEGEVAAAVAGVPALPAEVARRLGLALASGHPREAAAVLRVAIEGILAGQAR